jgi:hypothetical protein
MSFFAHRFAERFFNKLAGRTVIEDALQRLNWLTQEEGTISVVRNLEVSYHVDDHVKSIKQGTQNTARWFDHAVLIAFRVLLENRIEGDGSFVAPSSCRN